MSYEELMKKVKEAIKAQHPEVDVDKLDQIYSSRMMEIQRVIMQSTEADVLYSVTINMLEDSVRVKTYVAQL